ncbi:hypothetical protein V8F33_009376 [Rhypophila sp. PSN 637]
MGFFSFLSRKSHREKSGNPLKSQDYKSTSLGALPVQGPYPAAGNGPNVLESLTRPRPETGRTETSLAIDREDPAPAPAPAPAVPRFREELVERPSTAPNGSSPGPSWNNYSNKLKKGPSRGAPPVSFRMFKRTSVAQDSRPGSRGTDKASSALQQQATPSHAGSRSRASSLRSENGRGFKDVLDAQSEIRPADFRTRVKAAGARDYGEDVADRNLALNGFNLEAPQVQAFYGQSCSVPSLSRLSRSEDPLRKLERRPSLYDTGVRAQSLTSTTQFPVLSRSGGSQATLRSLDRHERASVFARDSTTCPRYESPGERRPSHSANTFIPAPQTSGGRTRSMDRTVRFYPFEKRNGSPRPTTAAEKSIDTPRGSSPRPNTSTPILLNQPWVTKQGPMRPSMVPRDSVLLTRQRADQTTSPDHANDEANFSGGTSFKTERSYSLRSSSAYPRASVIESPRKRHSLHTLQPSVSSPVASREGPATTTPSLFLAPTREQQSLTCPPTSSKRDKPDEMGFILPSIPVQDVFPKASLMDKLIPSPSSVAPFTSPETSVPSQRQTDNANSPVDACERLHTNPRSLRASSVSSATATVSDTSSNPFQRPHSRHTVNTSVDLSAPSPKAGSRTSLHTPPPPPVIDASTSALATDLDTTIVSSPDSNDFNIDDYVSSDDDSIAGSRHPLGDGEEDLLFNDSGYGAGGMQLPGLFDSLALTPASRQTSQQTLQHHSSSPTLSPPWSSGRRMMNYTGDSFGRAAGRRFIIDTGAVDDDEDEYDNHESDATSELAAYQALGDDAGHDGNDEDSLYSRRSSDRRQESLAGTRPPPVVLHPSRAANRLSAIIPPNATATTNTTTKIPRPSSAHYRDPPYHKHSVHHSQARYVVGETAVIEELEEQGTGGAEQLATTITAAADSNTKAAAITAPRKETAATTTIRSTKKMHVLHDETTAKDQMVYSAVDVLAAVKLRKEIKARNRAAGGTGPGATKMSINRSSSRWSIANSNSSSSLAATNGLGSGGPATNLKSDDQDGSDDTMSPRSRNSRPVSSINISSGAGSNIRGRVITDLSRDLEEDNNNNKKKRLVQVEVREVGLGLTLGKPQAQVNGREGKKKVRHVADCVR